MTVVYIQLYTTLGVYLRDTHGVPERAFGYIMSLNAATVVLLQFPIARRVSRYQPMMMMALGTLLYAIGFGMYGLVSTYLLFAVAMFVITVGEMVVMPVAQALVAKIAPEDMRGRYMAVFGFSWAAPQAVGPFLAGLVMDNADPRWVWYGALLVGLMAAGSFALLNRRVEQPDEEIIEMGATDTPARRKEAVGQATT
jgi:MFS family permease